MNLFLLVPILSTATYEILDTTTDKLIIKLDPVAYNISLSLNHKPKEFIIINSNYFWKNTPIGIFIDGNRFFENIPLKYYRPPFNIGDCIINAGPTIIKDYKVITDYKDEGFRSDVLRKTSHTFIGISRHNKVVLGYYRNATPIQIAKDIAKYEVKTAIKLDGGSSAYIKVGDQIRGQVQKVVCALIFEKI